MSQAEFALPPPLAGRLVKPSRERRSRLPADVGISVLLHALLLAVALIVLPPEKNPYDKAATSEVALVLEGGKPANTPQTEDGRKSEATTLPDPNQTEQRPPGAPSPPIPAENSSPQPPTALPPANVPEVATGEAPLTLPPPISDVPRATTAARPAPLGPEHAPRATRAPSSSLSAPMDFSLSGPPPPTSLGRLKRGAFALTMAPTAANRNIMTRYAEARRSLGEDWWAAFSAFVEAHKYYPEQARERDEDGDVVLHLVILRSGEVQSVKLERSSGSPRLDAAWISEFRNQMVPAFPPGTTEGSIDFPASMTYILLHE